MPNIYQRRRANLSTWMAQNSIAMVIIEDSEQARNAALRYFSGHAHDAVLGISIDGSAVLSPWDDNLAKKCAKVNKIIPFNKFNRNPIQAAAGIADYLGIPEGSKVEIPATVSYPDFLKYVDTLEKYDVLCRDNGVSFHIAALRSIKDCVEIECIKKAAEITDLLIDKIEEGVKSGSIKTESDVALLIEREARIAGCEGTGFNTLAAGPDRSFGIHCFPEYTAGLFATNGLSILDFGLMYEGYTSDVTMTFAVGALSVEQEKIISLVQDAYNQSLELYKPGVNAKAAFDKAQEVFAKEKYKMPHALGHGIGLETHEAPFVRGVNNDYIFAPGMVVTLEPGLYNAKEGGCRLENDVLITEDGCQVLTHSRIVRL